MHPFLQTGFRPFFLFAAAYALVAVLVWSSIVLFGVSWPLLSMSPVMWHAHEMIFGYTIAVAGGFLLTAVRNWTGQPTAHGGHLLVMVLIWALARILFLLLDQSAFWWVAGLDLLFWVLLCQDLLRVIIRARQWKTLAVWSKLALFGLANALFYIGIGTQQPNLSRIGLYIGLWLAVGLILMLGRRLFPFFIERAAGGAASLTNRDWLDRLLLLLFVLFIICALTPAPNWLTAGLAGLLFLLHVWRMLGWRHAVIWRTPLVWVLYLGYGFVVLGFLLYALSAYNVVSVSIAAHAFAYGGVGMLTLGMMARITLGHTGRDVYQPPSGLGLIFGVLAIGTLMRVLLPWVWPAHYLLWIGLAQMMWVVAFAGYLYLYAPMLVQARADGKAG